MGVLGKQKKREGIFQIQFLPVSVLLCSEGSPSLSFRDFRTWTKETKPGKVKKVAKIPILCGETRQERTSEGFRVTSSPQPRCKKNREEKGGTENPNRKPGEKFQVGNPGAFFGTCASLWGLVSISLQLCLPPQPVSNVPPQGKESFPSFRKTQKEKFFQDISLQEGFLRTIPQEIWILPGWWGGVFPYFWCLVANRICCFCCQYFTKKLSPTRVFLFPSLSGRFSWITGSSPKTKKNLFSAQKNQEKHPHSSLYPKKLHFLAAKPQELKKDWEEKGF